MTVTRELVPLLTGTASPRRHAGWASARSAGLGVHLDGLQVIRTR